MKVLSVGAILMAMMLLAHSAPVYEDGASVIAPDQHPTYSEEYCSQFLSPEARQMILVHEEDEDLTKKLRETAKYEELENEGQPETTGKDSPTTVEDKAKQFLKTFKAMSDQGYKVDLNPDLPMVLPPANIFAMTAPEECKKYALYIVEDLESNTA